LREAKRRFRAVLAQLRAAPESRGGAVVDQALDLAPAITKVLVNPLDVTAYSANLVKTPRDWIRTWWLRRPYRLAFRLRERLLAVRGYGDLLAPLEVGPEDIERFTERYGHHLDFFRTYGPARRPA